MTPRRFPGRPAAGLVGAMLVAILLIGGGVPPVHAGPGQATVTVNGRLLELPVPPINVNGRLMVPMRVIFEALGAQVQYDDATRTIAATLGYSVIFIRPGVNMAHINGRTVPVDPPPRIVESRLLVPLRFVAEALGAEVAWNSATSTAAIVQAPGLIPGESRYPGLARTAVMASPQPMASPLACRSPSSGSSWPRRRVPTWRSLPSTWIVMSLPGSRWNVILPI